jgi:hypothetical protein
MRKLIYYYLIFCKQFKLSIPRNDLEIGDYIGYGPFGAVFKGLRKGRGGGYPVAIKKVVHCTTSSFFTNFTTM